MHKVLVVENNPTSLKLICHHLEMEGCTVTTAHNGLEALVRLDGDIPDIVFTDIIMPKVSGDQLCHIIRKTRKLKDIFIVIYSSTSLEDNREILDLDADVYIAKSSTVNLRSHIVHVLEQYRRGERRNPQTIGDNIIPREITRELLLARQHYHAIYNSVSEAVIEMDSSGMIIQANTAMVKLLHRGFLDILSLKFVDFIEGDGRQEVIDWIAGVDDGTRKGQKSFCSSYEKPLLVANRRILLNMVAISGVDGTSIIGILQDITLQKATEETLARTLEEFHALIETIDYGILLLDDNLRTRIVNQAYRELWQVPRELTDAGPTLRELMEFSSRKGIAEVVVREGGDRDALFERRIEAVRRGSIAPLEIRLTNGKVLQYQCTVLPNNGRLLTYYDITGLKQTEKQLEEALEKVSVMANHDALTGLPNLRLARERLLSALALSRRKGWMAAIMFIDLDGFKEVNDSYGHEMGDKVLRQIAARLLDSLRQADTVARIGGDEFLVILTEVPDRLAAAKVAEKIVSKMAESLLIDGVEIHLGASIGISLFPENGEDSRVLIKKADDAMYYTKRIGKNNYSFAPGEAQDAV